MDAVLDLSASKTSLNNLNYNSDLALDALVIETSLSAKSQEDSVSLDFGSGVKSLTVSTQEIVAKLNELLKADLPGGIESLKAEDFTPEATADRIVQMSTGFFEIFRDQNPEMSDEEALDAFMETIKGGIQAGYDDAFNTLQGLGAFEIDGIQSGVEETKLLIESKLESFYKLKREELGLDEKTEVEDIKTPVAKELLAQGGAGLSIVV